MLLLTTDITYRVIHRGGGLFFFSILFFLFRPSNVSEADSLAETRKHMHVIHLNTAE